MINNVTLMGRLTANPELKKTGSDISVLSFTIAVDKNYSKDEKKEADFINCVAWRGTAEFVSKYFRKGSMIALTGSIQVRKYDDKEGNKRTAVEVLADNVSFCGGKSDNNTETAPTLNVVKDDSNIEEITTDDDLPF